MTQLQFNCIITPVITINFEKAMDIQLTKLRSSKIPYNSQIVIPRVYVEDNNIEAGDTVEIYRGTVNGKDAIVILPSSVNLIYSNYKNLVNNIQKQ